MPQFDRRQFLSVSLAGLGTLLLPRWAFALTPSFSEDPHFFLHIQLSGGADQSYLFDARPLAMTAAGKMQNYLGEEPKSYQGINGGSCLLTSLAKPLEPFLPRFSVLNGVVMATAFEGHDQNLNFLLSGNPFGGESFLPHLNQLSGKTVLPLDGLSSGFSFSATTNDGGTVIINPGSVDALKTALAKLPNMAESELGSYLAGRYESLGAGPGRFSQGAARMLNGFTLAPELKNKLVNLDSPNASDSAELQFVTLLAGAFRNNVARTATLVINEFFDTHSFESAQSQPKLFGSVASKLAEIFQRLESTPFSPDKSLLDVTTVLVGTEFGRTMRIEGFPVDKTGTNHNPLTNTFFLGGKGVRGGMVVGASDFATPEEEISKAHRQLDPILEKVMGRAFDFALMAPRPDLPNVFDAKNYLTAHSLVNTIYQMFGVPAAKHRVFDRESATAPILRGLLR